VKTNESRLGLSEIRAPSRPKKITGGLELRKFEIAPGDYRVDVALGSGSESFGKLEAPLVIEPYASTALAVSGLALGKEVRQAADLTSSLVRVGSGPDGKFVGRELIYPDRELRR
jgi:hypothetical protein